MKYLITKYNILYLFVFCSYILVAGHEKGIESFKGNSIFTAAQSSTSAANGDITNKELALHLDIMDHSYRAVRYTSNWMTFLNLSDISNDVVLRFDDDQRKNFQSDWSMVVEYTIYFNADESFDDFETGQLEITYNQNTDYIDQQRKVFTTFGGSGQAHQGLNPRVYIREVTVTASPSDETLITSGNLDLYFDLELHTEKCYLLQDDDLRVHVKDKNLFTFANTSDYDFAEVNWGYVEGAEQYELEWLFVDLGLPTDEALTLGTSIADYPNFEYNFDNAFGITIQENTFKIPLHFPTGILLYRVRPVGYSDCDTKVYGDWSSNLYKGYIHDLSGDDYLVINGFETDRTWQSSSSFIEGGKHADAISYYDGSLRPRQSIAVNKKANIGVVNTPVFDYSGRSTLTLAPFAVENNSLKYKTNVTEYPRASFDATATIGTPLDYTPQTNEISASKYYSADNTFTHSHKDYIPKADNKPFSRTLIKNDGTNRIKEQSGMGPDFQIGSGKTTKYYYYKPSQYELDVLFGNDAGYAENYSKEIIIDPNGQGTYVIKNNAGKVIVSGLYGEAPPSLDAIPAAVNAVPEQVSLDITNQNFEGSNSVDLNHNFDVASQTNPSQLYYNYKLDLAPDNVDYNSNHSVITFKSSYEVERDFKVDFSIKNSLGQSIASSGYLINNNSVAYTFSSASAFLPESYTFHKKLSLDNSLTDVLQSFGTDQEIIHLSDYKIKYQACECKEECIGSLMKSGYWFVPIGAEAIKYYGQVPSNAHTVTINNIGQYHIVKLENNTFLSSAQIGTEKPFVDNGGSSTHGDPLVFSSDVIHCSYSCDYPSDEFFEGFQSLANQVYPGSGIFWDLSSSNGSINPYDFWVSPSSSSGLPDIFTFTNENGVAENWNISGSSQQDKLQEFAENQWGNVAFWESLDDKLFQVSNPYKDENGLGTTLVLPFTQEYYLKYILLPKHPEFNLLNDLYTNAFVSYYKKMVDHTVFVPYNPASLPVWVTDASDYYESYAYEDVLAYLTVDFSELPLHPDPSVSVVYPASIYDINDVLKLGFPGSSSVYDFMDNSSNLASGPIKDQFHGSSIANSGLFNYNLPKEFFYEGLYEDLRRTKHFASYFSNNDLIEVGTSVIPGHTYTDLNITPVVDASYVWQYMNVDLINLGTSNDLTGYLNVKYPNNVNNIDVFKTALKDWFNENIFIGAKSYFARTYFENSPVTPTPAAVSDYLNVQSSFNIHVKNKFRDNIGDYVDNLVITYNTTTSLYDITLNSGTVIGFNVADAENSLFDISNNLFNDFKAQVPSNFADVIVNPGPTDPVSPIPNYTLKQNLCAGYLNGLSSTSPHDQDFIDYFPVECDGTTVTAEERREAIRDAFLSNEFYIYHYYDSSLPAFDDQNGCPLVDYLEFYEDFRMPVPLTDCYCNTLKELAIPFVNGASTIDDINATNFNVAVAEDVLGELGIPLTDITGANLVTHLISPATSGSCFNNLKSVNNLDNFQNDKIYDLLCNPHEGEDNTTSTPCVPLTQTEIDNINQNNYQSALDDLTIEFKEWYLDNQFTRVTENIVYNYPQKQYQQTLYYYDRAGNLIKTVAPEGVEKITDPTTLNTVDNYRSAPGTFAYTIPDHKATEYTYNSLNQMVTKNTPELSAPIQYYYDMTGRLIASQSPEQKDQGIAYHGEVSLHTIQECFSYTLYDDLGRVKESGVARGVFNSLVPVYSSFETYILSLERREVHKTHYDLPAPSTVTLPFTQRFLRNRVSWTEYHPVLPGSATLINDDKYYEDAYSKQYYSYDVHGNVNHYQVEHRASGVSSITKHMKYTYDLISGNVIEFAYQPNELDQFYHRYYYDESNRLIEAESSDDHIIWETEAKYFYYPHGPLARVELGDKQVQGTDYAYTLHGWLKSVNGLSNNRFTDMSKDGKTGASANMNRNAEFAQDELSFKIDYFDGDYKPITTNAQLSTFEGHDNLYNGNIAGIAYDISDLAPVNYTYRYDQLQRLTKMQSYSALGGAIGYKSDLEYDANGNITRLKRYRGGTGGTAHLMDDIQYDYSYNTLSEAIDLVDDPTTDNDYVSYADFNYRHYDRVGNEIFQYGTRENYSGIKAHRWFYSGKVKSTAHIFSDNVDNDNNPWRLNFFYDGGGSRIAKVLKIGNDATIPATPVPPLTPPINLNPDIFHETTFESVLETEDQYTYTYYINDPTGNTIATYTHKFEPASSNVFTLKEELTHFNIYGSKRLGTLNESILTKSWNITNTGSGFFSNSSKLFDETIVNFIPLGSPTVNTGIVSRTLGLKRYELSNHLGNILTTVSDRKEKGTVGTANGYYIADVKTYSDYYPFGMQMPERHMSDATGYRYGYQGSEKDDEIAGEGNSYATFYRLLDPRIGRWKSVDPKASHMPWQSPYTSMDNNPILLNDPNGDCPLCVLGGILIFLASEPLIAPTTDEELNRQAYIQANNSKGIQVASGITTMAGGVGLSSVGIPSKATIVATATNPETLYQATGFVWGLGTDEEFPDPHIVGDNASKTLRHFFRGTTKGWKGGAGTIRAGVTPTSTNPLVSVLYAIQHKSQHGGDAVLEFSSEAIINGEKIIGPGYIPHDREVILDMLPENFSEISSSVSLDKARSVLSDMGFDTPSQINDIGKLESLIKEVPDFTDEMLQTFMQKINE